MYLLLVEVKDEEGVGGSGGNALLHVLRGFEPQKTYLNKDAVNSWQHRFRGSRNW